MAKIKLQNRTFVPYISNEEIEKAIDRVAEKVNADYKGCTDVPIILCVLNGSIIFTAELLKRLTFNCELATIRLSSYQGTETTGVTRKVLGLTVSLKGRRVIVVEDIVDTGHTITDLTRILAEAGASDVKVCTMLFKPAIFKSTIKLDYVAMEIEPKFIVGFGLDFNELGRNLKDIYILDE
ncbi:MAG: hypoxanthine phosphoribosyltransferase [Bacteroidales bacterium]|nr:hypoxanthine phosphoribosyltransferase [Bacteroidales bacterium]